MKRHARNLTETVIPSRHPLICNTGPSSQATERAPNRQEVELGAHPFRSSCSSEMQAVSASHRVLYILPIELEHKIMVERTLAVFWVA